MNDFDEHFNYSCPFNSVIAGQESIHANRQEDRRYMSLSLSLSLSLPLSLSLSHFTLFLLPGLNSAVVCQLD